MYKLIKIHRRNRGGTIYTYATLVDPTGETVIGATLDYILDAAKESGYQIEGVDSFTGLNV